MFLDLRFLLEILLRWLGPPATAAERGRRAPAAGPGRTLHPGDRSSLSLPRRNRDHEA